MSLNVPSDALPEQPHLMAFRPCLAVQFGDPQSVDGKFYLNWVVRNIGMGVARKIAIFLPGIMTDKLDRPIEKEAEARRGTPFEDKRAFTDLMKPPVHLIAEFEDHAGNLYRQYAYVLQKAVPGGAFYAYEVGELDRPYLVAGRIVGPTYRAEKSAVMNFTEFAKAVRAEVGRIGVDGEVVLSADGTTYSRGALIVTLSEQQGKAIVSYVADPSERFGHRSGVGIGHLLNVENVMRAANEIATYVNDPYRYE